MSPSNFTQKEETVLSDKEEAARQRYNKLYPYANVGKAEWAADQRGELFPTDFDEDMY